MLISSIGYLHNKPNLTKESEHTNVSSRILNNQGFGTYSEDMQKNQKSILEYIKSFFSPQNNKAVKFDRLA